MEFLILTNGEYSDMDWYRGKVDRFDRVICVDGGAGRARELGIIPDWVVGDMDSIGEGDRLFMKKAGAAFEVHPPEKDFTDTQIALELAAREGAREITIWGGIGSRLDHNLSNILSATSLLARGINVLFESPSPVVYLVKDRLVLPGRPGDTVSLIALGERASGVDLSGFKYPLNEATLESNWQWAISNVIKETNPVIRITSGVLAVFHYTLPLP